MKLLQQQNGNTVVVEKFKSEFYVEIWELFNKRNEMTNKNNFVLFYFSIYQI